MQHWNQEPDGSFLRHDGARVKPDHPDPERRWTAHGPSPEHRRLAVTLLGKPATRTWRSAQLAMQAVDKHFPLRLSAEPALRPPSA